MKSLLYTLDEYVMNGINAGIRAYNWTTGGTKEELAKLMQIGAAVINTIGPFSDGIHQGLGCLLVRAPVETYFTYKAIRYNKQQIKLEESALEKNLKDPYVEGYFKPINMTFAYTWATGSLIMNSSPLIDVNHINKNHDSASHYSDIFSSIVRSTGCLTICGENLPPRKNCLKRGLEKLTAMINTKYSPNLDPVPAI